MSCSRSYEPLGAVLERARAPGSAASRVRPWEASQRAKGPQCAAKISRWPFSYPDPHSDARTNARIRWEPVHHFPGRNPGSGDHRFFVLGGSAQTISVHGVDCMGWNRLGGVSTTQQRRVAFPDC